jgi:hypothetical protein
MVEPKTRWNQESLQLLLLVQSFLLVAEDWPSTTFSDESNAYRSVLLLLESLKNGTLSDKWPQWCVLYNVGGGPFVFLYRIIQQVGASCGSYICVSTPSNTRIQIVAAFVTEGNIGESPVYR